jgi:MSHA pilin protein MshC
MLQPANCDTGSAAPPCRARGFTLVELTITLVVVAIMAVAMLPRSPERQINLSAQADQLASDIRYTQSLAMTHGQRFRINFNAASYLIDTAAGGAVTHPHTGNTAAIDLGNGITLSATTFPFIVFDGRGTPYDNIGTLLAADAVVTLTADGQTTWVLISPQTGRVRVAVP